MLENKTAPTFWRDRGCLAGVVLGFSVLTRVLNSADAKSSLLRKTVLIQFYIPDFVPHQSKEYVKDENNSNLVRHGISQTNRTL
jgi:hypothetical protein